MSDLKLFNVSAGHVSELVGGSVALERSLQTLMEENLEAFLGVRFLASEFSTTKPDPGRIDTLGIDENNTPVIIEYKRSLNQNVINQGLFYLNWLMSHQADFTLLAMKVLGPEIEEVIDWSSPRLICIAGDFTRYDEYSVAEINRSIELIRYRKYGDEFMLLELVNSVTGTPTASGTNAGTKTKSKSVTEYIDQSPTSLRDLYEATESFLSALGDDVSKKITQLYVAFRRIKNFACIEVHPQSQKIAVFVKVDPDMVDLEPGFTRDVRGIGHFGTGDLEITLTTLSDLEKAHPLLVLSYEAS